jgi:hypothetical protein
MTWWPAANKFTSNTKISAAVKNWGENKKIRASEGIRTPGWRHHKPLP